MFILIYVQFWQISKRIKCPGKGKLKGDWGRELIRSNLKLYIYKVKVHLS